MKCDNKVYLLCSCFDLLPWADYVYNRRWDWLLLCKPILEWEAYGKHRTSALSHMVQAHVNTAQRTPI